MSSTYTRSSTFTITHARYLSSKVAADMHLCALYYGEPSEQGIRDYAEEFAILLRDGYVDKYEFGYKKLERRIVCWRYTVSSDGTISTDDGPGKLVSTVEVDGATFYNFLWHSSTWNGLSTTERDKIQLSLPIKRVAGSPPSDGSGYWTSDKHYSSGGVGLGRQTFRMVS